MATMTINSCMRTCAWASLLTHSRAQMTTAQKSSAHSDATCPSVTGWVVWEWWDARCKRSELCSLTQDVADCIRQYVTPLNTNGSNIHVH